MMTETPIKEMLSREILVLGDSHTPVFNHPSFRQHFPDLCFNVVTVIGATASGLENPNTKTRAYPIFKEALRQSSARKIIVMLGEVDTGFVIWYRAKKIPGASIGHAGSGYCQLLKIPPGSSRAS